MDNVFFIFWADLEDLACSQGFLDLIGCDCGSWLVGRVCT